jgi:predicted RNase H-like HicB family nuclease
MMLPDDEMIMEYDEMTGSYYVIWEPMAVIGMGQTKREALDDLREAANLGIETLVNLKLAEVGSQGGEKHD